MLSEGIQKTKNLFRLDNCEKPTKNLNFSETFFIEKSSKILLAIINNAFPIFSFRYI